MNAKKIKTVIEKNFPCQVGFVKARIYTELQENLQKYYQINHDLKIVENNIDKRINPFIIYKDVKTIIVVIFPYGKDNCNIENKSHIVSRSSWGIDYHLVIKEKLKIVEKMLKDVGKEAVILTDSHPLHERHLAYLAGLGNYGKNTLLINPKYGSFFFISLVLTDLELTDDEYSKPQFNDICKDCNRCIKACPSQAISEDRFLKVNRCMSYLTQSKREIPYELLNKFTKYTFGCDLCQLACKYNKIGQVQILQEFNPYGLEIIKVKNLINLSNKTFKEKYRSLSASYRGKSVLLRNALLVSSNRNDYEDLKDIDNIDDKGIKYLRQALDYAKKKGKEGDKNATTCCII